MNGMYTYAVLCGSHVKVGRSSNVQQRIRQIQGGVPLPVSLLGCVDEDIERTLHVLLEENGVIRTHGEWFEYTVQAHDTLMSMGLVANDADGFGFWLSQQRHRNDRVGDLASDVKRDTQWPPRLMTKDGIESYLRLRGACEEAIEAFKQAWKEWDR